MKREDLPQDGVRFKCSLNKHRLQSGIYWIKDNNLIRFSECTQLISESYFKISEIAYFTILEED